MKKLSASVRKASERERLTDLGERNLAAALGAVFSVGIDGTDDPVDPQKQCPHLEYTVPA